MFLTDHRHVRKCERISPNWTKYLKAVSLHKLGFSAESLQKDTKEKVEHELDAAKPVSKKDHNK